MTATEQPNTLLLAAALKRQYLHACAPAAAELLRQHEVIKALVAALEEARTGLLWYQDSFPDTSDESDGEAMARIDAALALAKEQR